MFESRVIKSDKVAGAFSFLVVGIFLVVIVVNFYVLLFKKDYDFIIEVPCDPSQEECFERDCSNPGDCPPNELSNFKRYSLRADDFQYCENEDCATVCASGEIECTQIECTVDELYGEYCVSPVASENVEGEDVLQEE